MEDGATPRVALAADWLVYDLLSLAMPAVASARLSKTLLFGIFRTTGAKNTPEKYR